MSGFSKQDYELINLGVCIKNQADRLDVEHEGVPLERVVVRIAEAAIAARREAIRLMTAVPRSGVAAEEPEWEYGERSPGSTYVWGPWTAEKAESLAIPDAQLVRRRKAGPWVPVKQEGNSDAG